MKFFTALLSLLNHPNNKDKPFRTIGTLIWWKLNQIYFKLPAVYQLTSKIKILCEPDSSYGSFIIYAGFPEYAEMKFIHDYLSKSDVMVDVGANIGAVSLLAADKITTGKVYCFEPTPKVFKKLQTNIVLNSLTNTIKSINSAVSNKSGYLQFIIEEESEVNHISNLDSSQINQSIQVKSVSLDEFILREKIKKINLLKVDVEGAEYSVFEGAKQSLKNHLIEIIVFEVNPKMKAFGTSLDQLLNLLNKYNYSMYKLKGKQLIPFDASSFLNSTENLVAVSTQAKKRKKFKKLLIK